MLDSKGVLTPLWIRWFDTVAGSYDNYKRPPDLIYTTDKTLTTDDFGKTILFDCTNTNLKCSLMAVTARDLNSFLTIYRKGDKRLTIVPPATVRIEHGSYGGRVFCDEEKRAAANLTLQVLSVTQLAITGGTGVWKTT